MVWENLKYCWEKFLTYEFNRIMQLFCKKKERLINTIKFKQVL